MSKLLTIAELSKITGLGVTSIRRRIKAGTLPYTRANANSGKLLFNEELVQTALRNEAYSHLKGCDMGDMIDTQEPKESTSYLAGLFKPSEDIADALAEQDINFGYEPRNTIKSASLTK